MRTFTEYMSEDHRHCDDVLASVEHSVKDARWDEADRTFAAFIHATLQHFEMEEGVLFPAFEQATGSTGGPTFVMRGEHQQMREMFTALSEALAQRKFDDFAGLVDTLSIMLQQHNMKEEGILYPMADRMLAASRETLLTEMLNLKAPVQHV